jgi:hypothetical protein
VQTLTAPAAKTTITWGQILPGDILDGYMITEVDHSAGKTRAYFFQGGGWSAWRADRPVSVYRRP